MGNTLKSGTVDLRSRSGPRREGSHDRDAEAAPEPGDPYLLRLRRAEAELEGAIEECRVALDEVRRELQWREIVPRPVVH